MPALVDLALSSRAASADLYDLLRALAGSLQPADVVPAILGLFAYSLEQGEDRLLPVAHGLYDLSWAGLLPPEVPDSLRHLRFMIEDAPELGLDPLALRSEAIRDLAPYRVAHSFAV